MTELDKNNESQADVTIQKDIVKEAIKEWLNEKVMMFGWFSLKTIGYACAAGIAYLWFITHGWSIPPIKG